MLQRRSTSGLSEHNGLTASSPVGGSGVGGSGVAGGGAGGGGSVGGSRVAVAVGIGVFVGGRGVLVTGRGVKLGVAVG